MIYKLYVCGIKEIKVKIEQVILKMCQEKLLDNKNVYVYASAQGVIGGVSGSIKGLVILSVYRDVLYIHRANLDNTYGKCLEEVYIPDMSNVQGKAGLFGGKFAFEYQGRVFRFKLPSRANAFVDYFTKK